ncbi:MAG TPA: glycerol kinase GlpK [Chitinophagaceae bacterium]|nr:glycerol kinase GlpK [Chitinophagaceae bacterium]
MSQSYILAIDQGTSSTKTLIFEEAGQAVARGSEPLQTNYLDNGWVEQDAETIFRNVIASVKKCLEQFRAKGFDIKDIRTIGISNQRETFVVWDRDGIALHPAIVWQCKRSVAICEELKQQGHASIIRQKTGLVIDPYFSATKLVWLFQNNGRVKKAIQSGDAFFGTIDCWLLYRLTKGKEFATDYTNASRTLFFNLHTLSWDSDLVELFGVSGVHLPAIKASAALFGETDLEGIFDRKLPITAMIGDSHAAAFGEGCFDTGTAKATLGTGCSILMNIGEQPVTSRHGMVTTICWSTEERIDFALEGVIVSCGATIEWLKNEMKLFDDPRETASMANSVADNGGVYLVPAFSGLGSPHWQMERRASISGLSFGSTKNHVVRAALESIPFQVKDVIAAMERDAGIQLVELYANGGMTSNSFVMQLLADLLNIPVSSGTMADVSALGAAYLAGIKAGVYEGIDALRKLAVAKKYYSPIQPSVASQAYKGWLKALK